MACASLMAGLCMNISDCGAEHSLGQALGGRFGLPHGLTIGLVLAETMDRDRAHVPGAVRAHRRRPGRARRRHADGSRAVRAVRRILAELEFPTLAARGRGRGADLDGLTEGALADYFISVAPAPWSAAEVRAAYEQGLRSVHAGSGPLRRSWTALERRIGDATRPALLRWEALPGPRAVPADAAGRRRPALLLPRDRLQPVRVPLVLLRALLGHPGDDDRRRRLPQRGRQAQRAAAAAGPARTAV